MYIFNKIKTGTYFLGSFQGDDYFQTEHAIIKETMGREVWNLDYTDRLKRKAIFNKYLCFGAEDELIRIDLAAGTLVDRQPKLGAYTSLSGNDRIIVLNKRVENIKDTRCSLYNSLLNNVEWTTEVRISTPWFVNEEVFFAMDHKDDNLLYKLDFNTGKIIHTIDFGQLLNETDQVSTRYIGEHNNKLYITRGCHPNISDYKILIELDVESGEILRTWKELELPMVSPHKFYVKPSDFLLDKQRGKLVGFLSDYSYEIDLASGDFTFKDHREESKKRSLDGMISSPRCSIVGNYLYARSHAEMDEYPDKQLSAIIVFDLETKEIVWSHVFTDTGLGPNLPQVTDTHLYQFDLNNNLHVFEKE